MDKIEAKKKIDELLQKAYDAVSEAESIADEHELRFNFEVSYGMGGTYYGAGTVDVDDDDDWLADYGYSENSGAWLASSQSC